MSTQTTRGVWILALCLATMASPAATSPVPGDEDDYPPPQRPPGARDTTHYRGPGVMASVGRVLTLGFTSRPAPSFVMLDPALQQWTVETNAELSAAIEAAWTDDADALGQYRKAEAGRNPCDLTGARLKTLRRLLSRCRANLAPRADSVASRDDPPAAPDERTRRWLTTLDQGGLKAISEAVHGDERAVARYILSEGARWSIYRRVASRVSALGRAARECASSPAAGTPPSSP